MNPQQTDPVSIAFSKQSSSFDAIESENEILQWMRRQIHAHCMRYFKSGDSILELNCGTGIDAIFFAQHGMHVHAMDIADGMLDELRKKITKHNLSEKITTEKCSSTDLKNVSRNNFDHIFSDFGGLNCVKEIDVVIKSFDALLKPGGTATLVIMPPVCPWELALAIKGNFKTALRRLKKNGAVSHLEGQQFMSYYFSANKIISYFGKNYSLEELQGLGSFVPPPYLDSFPGKYPSLFSRLKRLDEKWSHAFPFNRWADHFIVTVRKQKSDKI